MDRTHLSEMKNTLERLAREDVLIGKHIFLFGHADASLTLADELLKCGFDVTAILDNSDAKQGIRYKGIPVQRPEMILEYDADQTVVCIASRFFEAMRTQLRDLGFSGRIEKLVDYNSYAAYDLSDDTIKEKRERVEYGKTVIERLEAAHPGCFKVYGPFAALGDIYYMMSYLPHFLRKRFQGVSSPLPVPLVCVSSDACAKVVSLFGGAEKEVLPQRDLDAAIQASLYLRDQNAFIAHQDRPYVVNLSHALYVKQIPLEKIYCCGIFGLPQGTPPVKPPAENRRVFPELDRIPKGKSVIFSPYSKSVPSLPQSVWDNLIRDYTEKGYTLYTNVAPGEAPLTGTQPVSPDITELKSVVEHAGTFIGIRSGLCDILKEADCTKIALYPDYYYMDTKWKAIDMYALDGWQQEEIKP